MVRSVLTASDLLWAGLKSEDQLPFRAALRALDQAFSDAERDRMYVALDVPAWDEGAAVSPEFLQTGDSSRLQEWHEKLAATWEDIGVVWADRNVQGLGVALRAQAEHVGLGSLVLGRTYGHTPEAVPAVVIGPVGQDRLTWARRRMRWLLTGMTADPYDGLTVLEGFAHPSRFSMQAYMDRSLFESGTVVLGRQNLPLSAQYLGLVARRLVIASATFSAEARLHATRT